MKKRLISVLVFALAVSAGAAFVLYQLISSKVKAGPANVQPTTKVFVAARDLELGALIQERDLRTQDYLTVPAGAILKKEQLIGRGVTYPVHQDAPFFEAGLAPMGAGAGFAAIIPKGMRAFSVHVNEVVGVAGFAVAGMHVDVLVSGLPPGVGHEALGQVTRTLLQNIQVLSAGQNFQKDAEGKPVLVQVVNLLVTPQQAEILNLATDQRIQLVLRNPADNDIVSTTGAATANLYDGSAIHLPKLNFMTDGAAAESGNAGVTGTNVTKRRAAVEQEPEASHTRMIEVFSGDRRTETMVPDNNHAGAPR